MLRDKTIRLDRYTDYPEKIISAIVNNLHNISNKSYKIAVTMTTCKRLDLMKNTVNSFLNCCNDVNKIDKFICIDDNSSEQDRNHMKLLYPWLNYYMKLESEKGHRKSMNIIYDKLVELKPKYWIHMEDDFLFFDEMNYIEKGIEGLKLLNVLLFIIIFPNIRPSFSSLPLILITGLFSPS